MKNKLLLIFSRSMLAAIAMYLLNDWLAQEGIILPIGINPVTVLTSGILGFPGFALVYGIAYINSL